MISPSDLKYFIEIARCKTLCQASVRLGISQPSLSLALKRIETSIGEKLIIRKQKGLCLTPAGNKLLQHSKTILEYWNNLKVEIYDTHHFIQGDFTVGCHVDLAHRFIPKTFSKLLLTNQNLNLKFEHDLSRHITDAIINLEIDIGIVVNPLDHSSLIIEKIESDIVEFVATPEYINKLKDYNNLTLICDPNLLQTKHLLSKLQKIGMQSHRIIQTNSLQLIVKMALEGVGVAIIPRSIHTELSDCALVAIPDTPVYHDEICLVYHYENRNVASIKAMAKAVLGHRKLAKSTPIHLFNCE